MTTKYKAWLTHNAEKEKLQFPVLPEEVNIKCGSKNDSIHITGLGEIVIMQNRPAFEFSFSSFFPANAFPGVPKPTKPLTLVNKIKEWKESDKPSHLIMTDCGIDMYCTIEDFKYSEKGGDVGTIYYSISFKEYREITVRQVKVDIPKQKASVAPKTQRVNNTTTPKTYTVKSGDCLWNIAKKFYGSGSQYTKIYNANKSVIGGNPNLIYAGQVLTIPD